VTSQSILLASSDIKRHTSMGLFPLNIYLQVPGYPTNYPFRCPGNRLPSYGSRNAGTASLVLSLICLSSELGLGVNIPTMTRKLPIF